MVDAATQASFWRSAHLDDEPARESCCAERHKPLSKHKPRALAASAAGREWTPSVEWRTVGPARSNEDGVPHRSTALSGPSPQAVQEAASQLEDALLGVGAEPTEPAANWRRRPGGLSWEPPAWDESAAVGARRTGAAVGAQRAGPPPRACPDRPNEDAAASGLSIATAFLAGPTAHLFL